MQDMQFRSDCGGSEAREESPSRTRLKLVRIAEAPERTHGDSSSEAEEEPDVPGTAKSIMAMNGPKYESTVRGGARNTAVMGIAPLASGGLRIGGTFERVDEIRAVATIKMQEAKLSNRQHMERKKRELMYLNKESARRMHENWGEGVRGRRAPHKVTRAISPKDLKQFF